MLEFIFFILLFTSSAFAETLPVKANASLAYIRMRFALGQIESGNDPSAKNKVTTASGKYQFMRHWDAWFKREARRTWTASIPPKGASKKEKARLSKEQDRLFDVYFDRRVSPWLQRYRDQGRALGYSDADLVAIYHRQGEVGAQRFLKTGKDPFKGRYGNAHLATHIKRMRRAMNDQLAMR